MTMNEWKRIEAGFYECAGYKVIKDTDAMTGLRPMWRLRRTNGSDLGDFWTLSDAKAKAEQLEKAASASVTRRAWSRS